MHSFLRDIRYGIRTLGREPGFTAVIVITLALGIGANTAIFSVLHAVVLQPLPLPEPDRLVMVFESGPRERLRQSSVSYPNFQDWREQNSVFEEITAIRSQSFTLTGVEEPERIRGARVSAGFFPMLRVEPALGRAFLAEEDRIGAPEVAILTDGLWRRRFNADPEILGRTLSLDGTAYTIVGILPQGFKIPGRHSGVEVWTPASHVRELFLNSRGGHTFHTIARLKPGISREQAQAEMDTIARRLEEQYPESNAGWGVRIVSLHDHVVKQGKPILLMLLGAVALVLLIACANVANMLLSRSETRRREFAVRGALGAGRLRLVRQLLSESILLGLLGGSLGVVLAVWGIDALLALMPAGVPRSDEVGLNGPVLGFAFAIAAGAGLLVGLLPALHATPSNLPASLREGGRQGAGAGRRRLRGAIVVAEVALALVLLVGAGLLFRSVNRLMSVDPGFNPENVLTFEFSLPDSMGVDWNERREIYRQILERIGTLPAVIAAGANTTLPLTEGGIGLAFRIQGRAEASEGGDLVALYGSVSTDYFKTIGMRLLRGRLFTEQDRKGSPGVIVINESMARRYWPDGEPLGERIEVEAPGEDRPESYEIVGIVADIRESILDSPEPHMFVPMLQAPWQFVAFAVRTAGDPMSLAGAVRSEVAMVTREAAPYRFRSLEQYLALTGATRRFSLVMLGLYSGIALVLAAVGIYGVLSYSVAQRTHEIGVRMAVGAERRDVLTLVLKRGLILVAGGVAIGLIGAAYGSRVLANLLFETSTVDPATFILVSLIMAVVAMLACYVPARRATRVDPMVALRYE